MSKKKKNVFSEHMFVLIPGYNRSSILEMATSGSHFFTDHGFKEAAAGEAL